MFGIGSTELVIILVFAFLLFGPDKLPGMGRTIGRALRQFREAQEGITKVVQSEVVDPLSDAMAEPSKTKTSKAAAAAAAQEDADIDAPVVAPTHTETFAERRARLKAEHEAQAAQQRSAAPSPAATATAVTQDATAVTQGEPHDAADEDADTDADRNDAAPAVASEPSAPDTSASALYSLTPRKEGGDIHA